MQNHILLYFNLATKDKRLDKLLLLDPLARETHETDIQAFKVVPLVTFAMKKKKNWYL